jgi:hypothetical protein
MKNAETEILPNLKLIHIYERRFSFFEEDLNYENIDRREKKVKIRCIEQTTVISQFIIDTLLQGGR